MLLLLWNTHDTPESQLCENVTSSSKPGVRNILQLHQRTTHSCSQRVQLIWWRLVIASRQWRCYMRHCSATVSMCEYEWVSGWVCGREAMATDPAFIYYCNILYRPCWTNAVAYTADLARPPACMPGGYMFCFCFFLIFDDDYYYFLMVDLWAKRSQELLNESSLNSQGWLSYVSAW